MAASKYGLADDFFSKDFILFPDYIPEAHLENDFDADISALGAECSPLDSGYISGENLESSPVKKTAIVDETKTSYTESAEKVQVSLPSEETAALARSEHGSIYNGVKKESAVTLEKGISHDAASTKSPKRSMSHDIENASPPRYSQFSDKITDPTPLQSWVRLDQKDYSHELLAYRLEQPAKKRKTAGRQ